MLFKDSTISFVNDFVLPKLELTTITNSNISEIINFIEDEFEKPLSQKLASGEYIDFDFFTLINNVISDLSLNK